MTSSTLPSTLSSASPESEKYPHALDIEQALLGALLCDNSLCDRVREFLQPYHFFDPVHQKIFEVLSACVQKGQLANPMTLSPYMQDIKGGSAYVTELVSRVVSLSTTYDYARNVWELYRRRQLIALGEEAVVKARTYAVETTSEDIIEEVDRKLTVLALDEEQQRGLQPLSSGLITAFGNAKKAAESQRHVVGVTTGFRDLDRLLGGLHPSDLVILAARPSMGKTALATNIALNAALRHTETRGEEGAQVAFFSLEMSSEQLALRILAQETQLSSDSLRKGAISQKDFPNLARMVASLEACPLYIDDTPALTVSRLRARARRLKRQGGLGLIVIDYLQLLASDRRNPENRVQELSEMTRRLKQLAKEINVPVLALSQLSRAVEQREDKHPQLADLRESGSIEQDADVVMFVYREEYYEARKRKQEGKIRELAQQPSPHSNQAEVIVAKQRHGPIGTVTLHFNAGLTKFSNAARTLDHEP